MEVGNFGFFGNIVEWIGFDLGIHENMSVCPIHVQWTFHVLKDRFLSNFVDFHKKKLVQSYFMV